MSKRKSKKNPNHLKKLTMNFTIRCSITAKPLKHSAIEATKRFTYTYIICATRKKKTVYSKQKSSITITMEIAKATQAKPQSAKQSKNEISTCKTFTKKA